ncbi:creatininase family protein [Candidatus Bipolaricaulota bacterium]|nr:creatininase family protein [Candidatus Bipolaricaulota bacterium]
MKIGEISWTDFQEAAPSLALIPTGSTEQHGPHGPMATDAIIAESIAEQAAEETETLLLPAITVGISREHSTFPGSLSLPPEVFRAQLREIILSASESGIEKFVVVNGHGGNVSSIREVCRDLYHDHDVKAIEWTWFNAVSAPEIGHAGKLETSLIMHLQEELINKPIQKGVKSWGKKIHGSRIAYDTKEFTENGVVGDPTKATKEKGEELFKKSVDKLADLVRDFLDSDGKFFSLS